MLFAQEKRNVINANDSKNEVKCPLYKKHVVIAPGAMLTLRVNNRVTVDFYWIL